MKIRIIKWSNVLNHCNGDVKMIKAFEDFRRRMKYVQPCRNPQDIVNSNQHSDLVTCQKTQQSRIVFNIGANKYRMISGYHFGESYCSLFVKFVGGHKEYDKIDVCQVNMFKS